MYSLRSHNRLEIVQMAKSPEKVHINGFKCIVIVQLKYGYFVINTVTIYLAQVYEPGRHHSGMT